MSIYPGFEKLGWVWEIGALDIKTPETMDWKTHQELMQYAECLPPDRLMVKAGEALDAAYDAWKAIDYKTAGEQDRRKLHAYEVTARILDHFMTVHFNMNPPLDPAENSKGKFLSDRERIFNNAARFLKSVHSADAAQWELRRDHERERANRDYWQFLDEMDKAYCQPPPRGPRGPQP